MNVSFIYKEPQKPLLPPWWASPAGAFSMASFPEGHMKQNQMIWEKLPPRCVKFTATLKTNWAFVSKLTPGESHNNLNK